MFLSIIFFSLSIISLSIIIFSLYSKSRSNQLSHHGLEAILETQKTFSSVNTANTTSSSETYTDNQNNIQHDIRETSGSDPNLLSHSLLLEMLPSDSPRWAQLFKVDFCGKRGQDLDGFPIGTDVEEEKRKKRKKRGKKKRPDPNVCCEEEERKKETKEELVCLYPFTTSTSAAQRKIKQQYDQLVKSHESNRLTLAQVHLFILND